MPCSSPHSSCSSGQSPLCCLWGLMTRGLLTGVLLYCRLPSGSVYLARGPQGSPERYSFLRLSDVELLVLPLLDSCSRKCSNMLPLTTGRPLSLVSVRVGLCVCYRSRKLLLHLLEEGRAPQPSLSFPMLSGTAETAGVPPLGMLRMPKMPRHRLFHGFLLLALPWGS